ncbi:MAG: TetR/AcrR family transcriptional regulator [Pseudomonadota bacterium]
MEAISVTGRLAEIIANARGSQPLSERQREMLQAALGIVVKGGFEALSLRRVAEEVGVKLPSVQHHFGSKDGLVGALYDWALEWYTGELLRLLNADHQDPERAFRRIIDYLVNDLKQRTGIEPHLWARAMHSEEAEQYRSRYMFIYREFIYELLTRIGTIKTKQTRWYRAANITALIEGNYLLTSASVPDDLKRYQAELKNSIWMLAGLQQAELEPSV